MLDSPLKIKQFYENTAALLKTITWRKQRATTL